MTANGWLLALHLTGLFFWIGTLLSLTRLLGFSAGQDADLQGRTLPLAQRLYRFSVIPGGLLAIITGLLMLHGVGTTRGPGDSLSWYFKPRFEDGEPSFWYVTFHVKLVAFVVIALCDAWIARQMYRLGKGLGNGPGWALGALLALGGILVGLVGTWLALSAMGVGIGRQVGYGVGVLLAIGGFVMGRKLAAAPGRGRFSAVHGVISGLLLLIIVLVLAKPLVGGAPLS